MKQTDKKENPLTYLGVSKEDRCKDTIPIKEQYREIVNGWNDERTDNFANRCTEIAEDFAVEFAEWLFKNYNSIIHTKQLLIIFKKEKGL